MLLAVVDIVHVQANVAVYASLAVLVFFG